MLHKEFIIEVCKGILREVDPGTKLVPNPSGDDTDSEDLLSPTAANTPTVHRFHCKGEERASIARSRHYK